MRASKSIFVSMAMCLLTCLSAEAQTVRSEAKVRIAGEDFYVHHIQKGDTFYSIGKVYNKYNIPVTEENIAFYHDENERLWRELEKGKTTVQLNKVNQVLELFGETLYPKKINE